MEKVIELVNLSMGFFYKAVAFVVVVVGSLGYPGIVMMMALESSFIPFPSEVVIPPAGYLTVQGDMNIIIVIICGVAGSLIGATVNYMLAYKFGRPFLNKYAKFLFITEVRLEKMDGYFKNHGEIITFVGRLIPVVRWYISFPAGLAKMNYAKFAGYTSFGAAIWVIILAFVGRAVGNNIELVKEHLQTVTFILIPCLIVLVVVYILVHRNKVEKQ